MTAPGCVFNRLVGYITLL